MKKVFAYLIIVLIAMEETPAQVVINEIMSSNNQSITDADGDHEDWIELYNGGGISVNLSGLYLSDDSTDLMKWEIPSVMILPQGHLLIFASSKDRGLPELHTNFKISASGEEIYLSDTSGIVSMVPATELGDDVSCALSVDGGTEWFATSTPTPSGANVIDYVADLTFSHGSGLYENSVDVLVTTSVPGANVHYTTDGSIPDDSDPIMTTALTMNEMLDAPAEFATVQSAVGWTSPVTNVNKVNVLKAVVYLNGDAITPIETNTYIVGDVADTDMPIASITVDPNCLFDPDTGFYVPGPNPGSASWYYNGNFHQMNREVPAHFEFFETDGEIAVDQQVGLKLHGGLTKTYSQKSLKLIARSEYGEGEMKHQFFPDSELDEYDRIIFRNGGQDYNRAFIRDGVINDLSEGLHLERQHARPSIVFLNGEYWGIHNIREKIDEHHLENLYGIDKDSIDFLQANASVEEGSDDDYDEFYDFVMNEDLNDPTNFAWIEEHVDVENFADYFITQMYFNNREWPHNNIKYWKYQGDGGKWRWILFDNDVTAGAWPPTNAINSAYDWMADTAGYPVWSRGPWLHMLTNQDYRNYYINRSADLQNTNFSEQSCLDMMNMHKSRLDGDMADHLERWQHIPNVPTWETRVSTFGLFLQQRPDQYWDHTVQYFGLSGTSSLTVAQSTQGAGTIKVSTMEHADLPWTGTYYNDVPVTVQAIPAQGYTFSHWQETGETDPTVSITLAGDETLTAVYDLSSPIVSGVVFNEVMASNDNGIVDDMGSTEDWFELYNASSTTFNVKDLYVTDNLTEKVKWQIMPDDTIQTMMEPGDFLFFWADKDPEEGWNHADFKLSGNGESLYIYQLLGTDTLLVDAMIFGEQDADISFGRYPDGSSTLEQMILPTPGSTNLQQTVNTDLFINEVLAKNVADLQDDQGNYSDWIEIYNAGSEATDLAGYCISDDPENPTKFRIPFADPSVTVVQPGGFMIFYADDDSLGLPLHLPFKFSSAGETVGLYYALGGDTMLIDELTFDEQTEDISFGRYPDGSADLEFFETTTPGASNVQNSGPSGITKIIGQGVTVYPNPFNDQVTLRFDDEASTENLVQIFSADGREIHNQIIKSGLSQMNVNMGDIAPGMYTLRMMSNENGTTQSFNLMKQ